MVQDVVSMLDRLHVLIIGPGLGRCPLVMQATARIIKEARRRQVALVLDGDALFLLTQPEYQTLLQGYSKAILTPNVVEFHRLLKAVGEADHHIDDNNNNIDKVDNGDPMYRLEALDKTIVILKGRHDQVFRLTRDDDRDNGETPTRRRRLICAEEGGLKRSGGIGDILAGTLGVLVAWHEILQTEQDETSATTSSSNTSENTGTTDHNLEESRTDWLLQSCWTACCITKRATKRAFDVKKRAMAAPDILQEIGVTVEHMTTTSAQI
jgi:ATP-dependent NAD(P)H-hydrate dehydratase